MKEKHKHIKPPPKNPKVRGLKISEGSKNKPQLLKIVDAVKNDESLDLQIRDGYLNIYYCGGSLLKISGFRGKKLTFKFDDKYFERKNGTRVDDTWLKCEFEEQCDTKWWMDKIDNFKKTMDGWFVDYNKAERNLQQRICTGAMRSPESPWIILDIEYAVWLHDKEKGRRFCRFDMIALKKEDLSNSAPLSVYIVEFKQGNKALSGKSGIEAHAKDLLQFITNEQDSSAREAFNHSVKNILREKIELGLLNGVNSVPKDRELEIKAIFLFHGTDITPDLYKRAKSILLDHGGTPLFWELSKDSVAFAEYNSKGQDYF